MDTRAFAELVRYQPDTIRKMVRAGRIRPHSYTITGRLRWSQAQVDELLSGGPPEAPSERQQDLEAHVMAARERARSLAARLGAGQPGAINARRP